MAARRQAIAQSALQLCATLVVLLSRVWCTSDDNTGARMGSVDTGTARRHPSDQPVVIFSLRVQHNENDAALHLYIALGQWDLAEGVQYQAVVQVWPEADAHLDMRQNFTSHDVDEAHLVVRIPPSTPAGRANVAVQLYDAYPGLEEEQAFLNAKQVWLDVPAVSLPSASTRAEGTLNSPPVQSSNLNEQEDAMISQTKSNHSTSTAPPLPKPEHAIRAVHPASLHPRKQRRADATGETYKLVVEVTAVKADEDYEMKLAWFSSSGNGLLFQERHTMQLHGQGIMCGGQPGQDVWSFVSPPLPPGNFSVQVSIQHCSATAGKCARDEIGTHASGQCVRQGELSDDTAPALHVHHFQVHAPAFKGSESRGANGQQAAGHEQARVVHGDGSGAVVDGTGGEEPQEWGDGHGRGGGSELGNVDLSMYVCLSPHPFCSSRSIS